MLSSGKVWTFVVSLKDNKSLKKQLKRIGQTLDPVF